MRKIALAALLAATVATPAFAQDQAPFSGPRVEGVAGWDHFKGDGGQGASKDGVVYGGAVGYDFQAGQAVFGAEAELTGSSADTRANDVLAAGDRLRVDTGRDIYVGGRIGYAVSPRALLYAKAGYTNQRIDARYDTATTSVSDHANLDGYRLGAGIEYKITPTAYIKGEYRYSNYSKLDDYDVDLDRHQLLAGVGVRF
ncbi:porin family protein [Sphingomonas cannabina]|uniref:outer membrane protein n=1 Tax=Sphingomonas cannabina TaxID=2899123 RepID=UPI001F1802EB|nr:porin family protein [Sphingomonas cannabina]UIJ45289.1 porin family protein [Sphingomonas cannabina]